MFTIAFGRFFRTYKKTHKTLAIPDENVYNKRNKVFSERTSRFSGRYNK